MANDTVRRVLIEVVGETSNARRELTRLRMEAARADRQSVDVPVIVDTALAERQITKFQNKIDRLRTYKATPAIELAIANAEAKLAVFRSQLEQVEKGKASARVDIDPGAALAKIAALRAALIDLNDQKVDPRIVIKSDQARAALSEVETDLVRAAKAVSAINFGDPSSIERNSASLAEYQRALRAAQSEVTTTERAVRRWSQGMVDPGDNLNKSFRGFLGIVKQINPVIQGVSLVIFTSMIPALIGLAGSAAGAAAGLLSLVPAAAAVGGALGAGLVAVFKSVSEVMDLRKRKQQAVDSQTRQSAQQDDQLASASRSLAEAQRAVRDAFQQRVTATRAVAKAESDAAQGIRDAQENAASAARTLKSTIVDAYDAMRKSVTDARDAVLDLRDAQLGVEESKLDLRDAKRALADFAKTGSKAMQDLGKKFEDISFDPKGLKDAVRNARKTGSIGGSAADDLERLTLNVEKARLREQQANNNVTKSEEKLKDARKTQADFARQGIAAYKPYTDAVKANTKAQQEATRIAREGIRGNAAVISAKEQLRDANERIVESEQRVKDAVKARGDVLKGDVTGPMALYRAELKKLTAGQRDLYDSIGAISGPLKTFRDAIADPILSAAADGIKSLADNMGGVNSWAQKLGAIGAANIRSFLAELKSDPQNGAALKEIGDESLKSAKILGGPVFQNFIRLMRNFAAATLPLLNEGFGKLADSLGAAADRTNDWQALQDRMRPLIRLAGAFASIIREAIGAFVDLGAATEPVFTPFLRFIRDGIAGFRKFTNSAKGGDRIRQFFKDTLPLLKSTISFLIRVGIVLAQAFQVVAPIIRPIVDVLNLLLQGVSFLLEKLLLIPAPIRGLAGLFIPIGSIGRAIGGLVKLLEKLPGAFGLIPRAASAAFGLLGRVLAPIGGLFEGLAGAIGSFGRLAVNGFLAPFRGITKVLGVVIKGIVSGFASGWDGIKKVFAPVAHFFQSVFGGIAGVVEGLFNGMLSVVKGAINVLISGVNLLIKGINAIPNIKAFGVNIGIPDIKPIKPLAKGGIATKATRALIGEAGTDEAVIPLRNAVLSKIGAAIAAATPSGRRPALPGVTTGATGAAPVQHITIVSPPGTDPDLVSASKKFGRAIAGVS